MIVITMDKDLENYDIEKLGQIYKAQMEQGVLVLPKGAKVEDTFRQAIIKLPSITVEEFKPTWREKLFRYKPLKPLEVEEVKGMVEKNVPTKPKPPED